MREVLAMARAEAATALHVFKGSLRCVSCDACSVNTGSEFSCLKRAGGLVHSEWTTTLTKMHYMGMLSGAVLIKSGMHTYRGNISNY